ncbi:MAG: efflux transporter outer membrane subunit, partial [Rhodoferax sp.]|nr:efflux transporter outer membrane subunit [Rhodoferax sp.]
MIPTPAINPPITAPVAASAPDRRSALWSATALAAALLLTGCGALTPAYERPQAPVPAQFPGTGAATAATDGQPGTSAPDLAWQDFFQDERLRQLIQIALDNNRDLRVAVLNLEQARAQLQVRRADEVPTVGVGATGSRQSTANGGSTTTYTAGFTITGFEADFFGRLRNLSEAAQAQLLGTIEARKTVQIGLIASVANSYLALQADDALLAITRETLASREESLRLTRLTFEHGVSSGLELRQAESLVEGARVTLAQLERQRALDANTLDLLLGQNLSDAQRAALPAGLSLTRQGLVGIMPGGLPSEVLLRRPDVRAAEQQLLAANANIGAARAAFYPRITLTTSIGTASNQLSGLFRSGSYGWSFAPQIVLPIFDGGRNQANLDAAQVGRDIAVAQYEKAIQTAFREVADALA